MIILFFQILEFPLPFLGSLFDFLDIYLLIIGYLLLFLSISTIIFGLRIKIADNWRYSSFILGQIFGFTLFFLYITNLFAPIKYRGPNFILVILDIFPVSVILIITGSLSLIWGMKEEWDRLWKVMSINLSIIIDTILLLLGFVIYETSYSGTNPFSGPSTPDIYVGQLLIISGILVNLGIMGILAINLGLKLKNLNIILLFTSIIGAHLFLLLGSATFILDFVLINALNLLYFPKSATYIIIGLIFAGIYSFFLVFMKNEIFEIRYIIKPLNNDDPLKKLIEISKDELEALKNIDIFTVGDLASEKDQEGISKIAKIRLDRIILLIDLARKSLSKKKET
ncbi:MAG: hypothetical protein HWN67_22150 [Candidatus Helarchaeota archaeon]|nr:hypothetical protein [Candidatus Helarchaeota archaeon]